MRGPLGVVVFGRLLVGRDVGVSQPHLAVLDHRVGVADLRLAGAQRLDLGADQLDPGLEPLDELVLVRGTAVGRHVAGRRLALAPLAHRAIGSASAAPRPRPGRPGRAPPRPRRRGRVTGSPSRIARPLRRADDRGLGLVEVEPLAAQPARRQEALVDVAELAGEADERPGRDHPRDLALEARASARASNSSRSSRNAAQTLSASRSVTIASRSRSEQRDRRRRAPAARSGSASPAPIVESSARWAIRSG